MSVRVNIGKEFASGIRPEIVKALRGPRSQIDLSKVLGFNYNKIARWENGHPIKWSEFAAICLATNAPLSQALDVIYRFRGDIKNPQLLIRHLKANKSIQVLTKITSSSEATIKRWLSGDTEPELTVVFTLMSHETLIFPRFLQYLLPLDDMPIYGPKIKALLNRASACIVQPELLAFLGALELESYRSAPSHSNEVLSKDLGVSVEKIEQMFSVAKEYDLVRKKGRHYQQSSQLHLYVDNKSTSMRPDFVFWQKHLESRMLATKARSRDEPLTYLVLPTSPASRELLRKKLRIIYEDMYHELQKNPGDFDRVSLLWISLVNAKDLQE